MAFLTEKEANRFARKTEWQGDCLIWKGSRNSEGYGTVTLRNTSWKAHRIAYVDAWGAIPAGMVVRHKCDTPTCVNPSHLEVGTDADNAKDKAIRRRTKTKINDDQVRLIRRDSRVMREIAAAHKISVAAVCLIKSGKRRFYVGG